MPIEVRVISAEHSAMALKELLEHDGPVDGVNLVVEEQGTRVRGLDPSVLTAVVGSAGVALGALITGLLGLASQKATKSIVIEDRNGRKIQYPADLSPEKVKELIAHLTDLERPIIRL